MTMIGGATMSACQVMNIAGRGEVKHCAVIIHQICSFEGDRFDDVVLVMRGRVLFPSDDWLWQLAGRGNLTNRQKIIGTVTRALYSLNSGVAIFLQFCSKTPHAQ